MSETRVIKTEFNNKPMFAVYKEGDIEDDKPKEGSYPVVSMGIKKAEAVEKHYDEFKEYIATNKKE